LLLAVLAGSLLLGSSAVFAGTTYTHLFFNATPSAIPQNGVVTFTLSTQDNGVPPTGNSETSCGLTLPCVPTDPSCPTGTFIKYVVTQLSVQTPNDPSGPDVYHLGTATDGNLADNPLLVDSTTEPLSVPYGPGQGGFTLPTDGGGSNLYYWWRITANGAPTNQKQPLTLGAPASPSPTGPAGTYTVDVAGTMYCTTSTVGFVGSYFFDASFQITTPEFGSLMVALAFGMVALFLLKKSVIKLPKL